MKSLFKAIFLFLYPPMAWAESLDNKATIISNPIFGYIITALVAMGVVIAFGIIKISLDRTTWSLADALSEETDVTLFDAAGNPVLTAGSPIKITKLCASTSRLIALFGLVAILMMYLGFGLVTLNTFASTNHLPTSAEVDVLVKFLFAGMTMFAPYLINKFSSVFDWLTPKKS